MASSAPWPGEKYSCFLRLTCLLVLLKRDGDQFGSRQVGTPATDLLTTRGAALCDPTCEPTRPLPLREAPCSTMKDSVLSRLST